MKKNKFLFGLVMTVAVAFGLPTFAAELSHLGSYRAGAPNEDGGVAEIVAYNQNNQKIYLVNGLSQEIQMISVIDIINQTANHSVKTITKAQLEDYLDGFKIADITSIDVSSNGSQVAVVLQAENYKDNGIVMILDANGNYVAHYDVGVQPDMVKFTPDGKYVLTADEGEPRNGYIMNDEQIAPYNLELALKADLVDPIGSVTIIDLEKNKISTADFTSFDSITNRAKLVEAGVIIKKGLNPSTDFEPEYITMTDSNTAYVVLQESNSIATLDIKTGTFTDISSLGFKNHNEEKNKLDANKEDKKALLKTENFYGTYMPDGIASYKVNNKTYILTANEGDGSEWGDYSNEIDIELNTTYEDEGEIKSVEIDGLNAKLLDGLDITKNYTFGGRSFSIYEVSTDGLIQVFDSGSDFEQLTSNMEYFNTTNTANKLDNRSDNKGPEPENVSVTQVGDKYYAYIGLERISGIMVYDVTNPYNAFYVDYINTRNFNEDIFDKETDKPNLNMGDVSPEGIVTISAKDSPTKSPLVITGNEVSGTVAVYEQQ
ncbi:hypothetical protein AN641_09085 [Candidatus Epulonipiscioides gigas]|nr:hypothetical protein AN641_09085 [Epulopiscium sp. SCG-C07WGA-EpuloA2]